MVYYKLKEKLPLEVYVNFVPGMYVFDEKGNTYYTKEKKDKKIFEPQRKTQLKPEFDVHGLTELQYKLFFNLTIYALSNKDF